MSTRPLTPPEVREFLRRMEGVPLDGQDLGLHDTFFEILEKATGIEVGDTGRSAATLIATLERYAEFAEEKGE